MADKRVIIYTDGSCLGNPGPGGWGVVILKDGKTRELSGGAPETTNNRMELMAVISALSALPGPSDVVLHSDSQYVIKAFQAGWLRNWKRNGWKKADGPLKNSDLWRLLDKLAAIHQIMWVWVKGHAGNKYNERCDELAVAASTHYRDNGDSPMPTAQEEEETPAASQETIPAAEREGQTTKEPVMDIDYSDPLTDDLDLFREDPSLQLEQPEYRNKEYLEALLALYNKGMTGIPFPCGNFPWCDLCVSQVLEDKIGQCAKAFMTHIDNESVTEKESA